MNRKRAALIAAAAGALAGFAAWSTREGSPTLTLTGLVTSDDVVVGPQIAGRLARLDVREGDLVRRGQLLAEIEPAELEADRSFFQHSAGVLASQVEESAASLGLQERETAARIAQASAGVGAAEADRAAAAAQLSEAAASLGRPEQLVQAGVGAEQDLDHARRTQEAAQARVASLDRTIEAQRAALALARAGAAQAEVRRAALAASRRLQRAAEAQRTKADVRLGYTRLVAPIDGVVDVRAARPGEFVAAGQPVVTLIDPDDLWVRADVEETYVGRIRLGDHLRVVLASGEARDGVVFHRGVDAGFATQRDVSRTKRDICTFEIRLRLDNQDRRLALGSTAKVELPLAAAR
ncbi:MAG TPA: HlyD family efflux transporter periplasmic adaptor subunit [Anaeromyxobacteraceae bacterium]|nr:HlyD family efflux transporter periplasmic adaptor subunit [Anaeromyxobacteraceae bacterium]